jgi:hypothetical protein
MLDQELGQGPFIGLTISTSGSNAAEKEYMGRLIERGGGAYSKNLTKECTHLVIKRPDSQHREISAKEK